ncbi:MAG: M28 family peptidase [Planctomycetota bacterium]
MIKTLGALFSAAMLIPAASACTPDDAHHHGHAPGGSPHSDVDPANEADVLDGVVLLTDPSQFSRAGEAYFSPDADWIIFQAVPHEDETDGPPRYSMYVAPLDRDEHGYATGAGEPILISNPGSANTCGWFHPTLPGVVLFGSTMTPPRSEVEAGYSRETSRYTWEFPEEMEVVTRTVRDIVEQSAESPALRERLLARPDLDAPRTIWERKGYDAEGSWSPDGRFVLFTAVDPETGDGDIHLRDLASGRTIPLIVEPGYDGGPFFSPDGRWICYRSDRAGDNLLQLFVAELAFDRRGVPTGIKREIKLTKDQNVNWAPFWHPSGRFLVYATSAVSHRNYEVFAVPFRPHIAASGVLPTPVRVTHAEGFDGLPVFNPAGNEMMWTGQRGAPDDAGRRPSQLYLARVGAEFPFATTDQVGGALQSHDDNSSASPVATALAAVGPDARRFHEHVTILASEWLGGRLPGTTGIDIAEEYIAHWFERIGLHPIIDDDAARHRDAPERDADAPASQVSLEGFFQSFELRPHGAEGSITARNVVGVLPGHGHLADRFIVVGAHHDHLGTGSFGSIAGPGEIHEGADDNASGVAATLLVAERLAESYESLPENTAARSIVFTTFSAEEMGLNGSRAFVRTPPIALDRCDLMVNFDMIGRITDRRVSVSGTPSGDGLRALADAAASNSPLDILFPEGLSSRSDHAAFYDAAVPVLFVSIDPFHIDYHTPNDEAWKLNPRDASLAASMIADIVAAAATRNTNITFQEVEHYERGPSISLGDIKVRFGIMPGNYNDTEPGVLVQRVSSGGSADSAGIRAGDRLMRWDGERIDSIVAWMEMLAAHEPGDTVRVAVERGRSIVEIDVELQAQ